MNALEDLPLGQALRDEALSKHRQNHAEDIQKVRVALLAACRMGGYDHFTADDVFLIAHQLGLPTGKWLGVITKGWDRVENTGRYQPSTLKQRHARPVVCWRILPESL